MASSWSSICRAKVVRAVAAQHASFSPPHGCVCGVEVGGPRSGRSFPFRPMAMPFPQWHGLDPATMCARCVMA
eukprot:12914219-Prorocentrum_lima.AAC.1